MVNSMVERATSDMLIGPDWAMNIEICDVCNRDPVNQAKDVVRSIKKRIGSKNPKVQLLALTLLETIVKNCGDIVHMHVAEKDVLHEMVKIVRKKPDFHVKEKILILVDTWQEAFGGSRARYPQYFAAYQELLRMGAVFPKRSESSAPVFTPPQSQPLSSYPQNVRNPGQEAAEPSVEAEFPTLSLTEIQNARGIMDVLAEMLSALVPENKEGLRQEVIVDLVEQCRSYKQRVVHLVNSTSFQRRRELGRNFDPLVLDDFDWGNEWIVPEQDIVHDGDDLMWEDVDRAVGASDVVEGRNFPHRTGLFYSRRGNASTSRAVNESDSDVGEEEEGLPNDDEDVDDDYGRRVTTVSSDDATAGRDDDDLIFDDFV